MRALGVGHFMRKPSSGCHVYRVVGVDELQVHLLLSH